MEVGGCKGDADGDVIGPKLLCKIHKLLSLARVTHREAEAGEQQQRQRPGRPFLRESALIKEP